MAFQVLDMRVSINSNVSTGSTPITGTPILVGDIGLITEAAANTSLAEDVRVWLSGTVTVLAATDTAPVQVTIERNGTSAPGTGTIIYTGQLLTNAIPSRSTLSVTAADFPPAAVVNLNQIRYTLFVSSNTPEGDILTGPNGINGIVVA